MAQEACFGAHGSHQHAAFICSGVLQDMRLVWKNCVLYNKKGDFVERLGNRASLSFENQWAMSGFAEEARSKRATAGLAAPKYDPGPITTKSEKPSKPKEVKTEKAQKPKAKVSCRG